MQKVAFNKKGDHLCLSDKAEKRLKELGFDKEKYLEKYSYYNDEKLRTDPLLIQVIEELGDEANPKYWHKGQYYKNSDWVILELPDDLKWRFLDRRGYEIIALDEDYYEAASSRNNVDKQ